MEVMDVKGKSILIKQTPVFIFSLFNDLSRFFINLPPQLREKVVVDTDSIVMNVKGFKIGVIVEERVPYSKVSFKDNGDSPFPFHLSFNMVAVGFDSTLFNIELNAELNVMMKMMIGGRIQEFVDKFTDQIELILSGQKPDISGIKPTDFS